MQSMTFANVTFSKRLGVFISGSCFFILIVFVVLFCIFSSSQEKTLSKGAKNPKSSTTVIGVAKLRAVGPSKKTSKEIQPPNPEIINTLEIAKLRTLLLPAPHGKQAPALLPPPPLSSAVPTTLLPSSILNSVNPSQGCTYNHQIYLPGDILKTEQGWIRCTPTLFFMPDSLTRQTGNPTWTAVQ